MWRQDKQETKQSDEAEGELDAHAVAQGAEGTDEVSAFVGKGVAFKGTISYSGTVRIDGSLDGEIHTAGVLLVGEEAVITAKITCGTIVCKGKITGDITATEKLKLRSPAVINAGVKTPLLSMEEGVAFNGTLEMTKPGAKEALREPALHSVPGGTASSGVKVATG